MKSIDIEFVTWKWQGCVVVGGTSAEFSTFAKKTFGVDICSHEGACGHAYVEIGKPWLLWLDSIANVPALAHEALHIAAGVLEARGLKYTEASEEAYTYTMEHIIRETLAAKKWRKL